MMDEPQGTTVVLADDHHIVREGFAALCAANGMQVIGQCSEGPAAFEMILELRPDFAILDLHMPVMTGVEVIRRLRGRGCTAKLLILSISREEKTVIEALRSRRITSTPVITGMCRSRMAKSGRSARIISSASGPSEHSPSTRIPLAAHNAAKPSRTM